MMKISDEIRECCDDCIDEDCCDELRELARRIDDEMVELPKDKDGEVIHIGDKVYRDGVGMVEVHGINLMRHKVAVEIVCPDGTACMVFPTGITHIRTDSLGRIANELDEWRVAASCDCRINAMDEDIVHDLAERIRKLAKEDNDED